MYGRILHILIKQRKRAVRNNMDYEYDKKTGKLSVVGLPYKAKLLEPPQEKQFNKIRSFTLHQRDLYRVQRYLNLYDRTDKNDNDKRRVFFNEAVISYMRCFGSGKRIFLQENAIFKNADDKKKHNAMKELRNKIIAHDEWEYEIVPVHLIYNEDKKRIEAVGCIPGRIDIEYEENAKQLREITSIALSYVQTELENEQTRLAEYFVHKTDEEVEQYVDAYITF